MIDPKTSSLPEHNRITYAHQILILKKYLPGFRLPPGIQANADEITRLYPDVDYRLWTHDAIESFINEHFDKAVAQAFRDLKPFAYKADLARYCLLYELGGLYVDLGIRLIHPWRIPSRYKIAAFRELNFTSKSWTIVQNGLIWAAPKRIELQRAIEWICENAQDHYYGEGPLYITGPVLFGRALASLVAQNQADSAEEQWIGEYRWVTPDAAMKNDAYVSPDNVVVAFRTKFEPGDLAHVGISGGNNYRHMWLSRQVYGEKTMHWGHDDERLRLILGRRTKTGIAVAAGTRGRISSGPYVQLPAGSYALRISFRPGTKCKGLSVEIGSEAEIIQSSAIEPDRNEGSDYVETHFTLSEEARFVEFILDSNGDFDGEISGFDLMPFSNFTRNWRFNNPSIRTVGVPQAADCIRIPKGTVGRVVFGPYVDITPGAYQLRVHLLDRSYFKKLRIDVAVLNGSKILQVSEWTQGFFRRRSELVCDFVVDEFFQDCEFRMEVFGDFDGGLLGFTLMPAELKAHPTAG